MPARLIALGCSVCAALLFEHVPRPNRALNEVTILGRANAMAILVNGQPVGFLTNDLLTTAKGAGIVAHGRSTFTFAAAYSIEPVP